MNESSPENTDSSPFLLRKGFEAMSLRAKKITLFGEENLPTPNEKPVIFACTHITDLDMPAALSILVSKYHIGIAHISAQNIKNDPLTALEIHLLGKENFFPLDYTKQAGEWKQQMFNPNNYQPMVEAMKKGKAIAIAAHNPTYTHELPKKGGYGAVYLAHLVPDAIIIPVAVNVHTPNEQIGQKNISSTLSMLIRSPRPDIDVSIGKPLQLPPLTPFENELNTNQIDQLREESRILMRALAPMLPTEKRGIWGNS